MRRASRRSSRVSGVRSRDSAGTHSADIPHHGHADEAPDLPETPLLSPARGALSASLFVGVSFDRLNRAGAGALDDANMREREDHDVPFMRRVRCAGREDQQPCSGAQRVLKRWTEATRGALTVGNMGLIANRRWVHTETKAQHQA
jgi:hypothetical protein